MSRKSGNIARHTASDLRKMRKRKEVRMSWKAVAKVPLPSGSDPDDAMDEIDWLTTELPQPRRKQHTSLRLDADMLAWFRAQGRGYQTRINAILRRYFEHYTR